MQRACWDSSHSIEFGFNQPGLSLRWVTPRVASPALSPQPASFGAGTFLRGEPSREARDLRREKGLAVRNLDGLVVEGCLRSTNESLPQIASAPTLPIGLRRAAYAFVPASSHVKPSTSNRAARTASNLTGPRDRFPRFRTPWRLGPRLTLNHHKDEPRCGQDGTERRHHDSRAGEVDVGSLPVALDDQQPEDSDDDAGDHEKDAETRHALSPMPKARFRG